MLHFAHQKRVFLQQLIFQNSSYFYCDLALFVTDGKSEIKYHSDSLTLFEWIGLGF